MRIFVTGIDGFVGRHLAARLASAGHEVLGTSLEPGRQVEGAARVDPMDLRDGDRVAEVVTGARPDALVHLAGETSVAAAFDDPDGAFRVNAIGTIHVLEACRTVDVGRVVVVGSSEVYGRRSPEDGPVPETAPLAPITPYGTSKAAQDLVARQYAVGYGMPVIRVRAFPHSGPGHDPRFVFPSVARRIARAEAGMGPTAIEVGWLGAVRDLADVRDVVRAYEALLDRGAGGEAYNVCTGTGRTIGEALETLVGLAEVDVTLERDEARLRPTEVEWMVGDPTKIREAIGWSAEIEWRRTMRDLLDGWRERVREEERKASA